MNGPGKQRRQRARVVAKALRNREETREKLLAQGRELARRRAENRERARERKSEGQDESESISTNPSVYSTMPSMDDNDKAAVRHSHSTVPARPKGSTVPAADRLYGQRLYRQLCAGDDGGDRTRQPDSGGDSSEPEPGRTEPAAKPETDSDGGGRR